MARVAGSTAVLEVVVASVIVAGSGPGWPDGR